MKKILLLCLCLYASVLLAQIPGIYKYTRLDGYTAGVGYRVNQDEKGYLWIGTDNGGVRFDGKCFVPLQNLHSSVNGEILECMPFHHNRVAMVPLFNRLFFLDHDTVIYLDEASGIKIKDTRWLNQYHHDIKNNTGWLWDINAGIRSRRIVYRISGNNSVQEAELPSSLYPRYVIDNHVIAEDLVFNRGSYSYDFRTQKVQQLYRDDGMSFRCPDEYLVHMDRSAGCILVMQKRAKNITVYKWTAGDSILKKVCFLKGPFTDLPLSSFSDQKKQYVFLGDARKSDMIFYYPDVSDSVSASTVLSLKMPNTETSNCFVDNHNNVWITSANNALYFLSENHIRNALAVQHVPLKESLPKCVAGTGDQLFISYSGSRGLTLQSEKKTVHLTLSEQFERGFRDMVVLNDSTLIVYHRDIALVDTRKSIVRYFGFNEPFKCVRAYGAGFLAGSAAGLSHIYKGAGGQYHMDKVFGSRTVAVASMDSTILLGTPSGMYIKQGLKGTGVKLQDSLIRNADVSDIALLDSSHALIATNGRGGLLYCKDGRIKALPLVAKSGESMPLYIRKLHRSGPYTYWAATNTGAFCIRFTREWMPESVQSYTFYDGLPSENVTGIFVRNDTAYVATTDGLGIIYLKDKCSPEMPVPLVYINSVQAGLQSFREPEKIIHLSHHQNDIRLQLSAISYESLGNVAYYYRLSPYQNEWIRTPEPDIRFSHLPPGNYRFEVYATNAKGGKSKICSLPIAIKPAFWQTIFFKIMIVGLFIVLVFVIVAFQIKRIEEKRYQNMQQKKHLAELELEAIKAQINPHFIYNCLNSIQYLNYKEDYEQAQQYLNTFSRLIRKTMRYAQKVFISVDEELEYLSSYLQMEQLRFKDRLQYSVTVEEGVRKDASLPAMLLQPYVENALKHGISGMQEGGKIDISFQKLNRGLRIMIKDNGPGFANLKSQDALGLRLSGTRALSYNELFNINVKVSCYNEQDTVPGQTGAVVSITITQTKNGTDNY